MTEHVLCEAYLTPFGASPDIGGPPEPVFDTACWKEVVDKITFPPPEHAPDQGFWGDFRRSWMHWSEDEQANQDAMLARASELISRYCALEGRGDGKPEYVVREGYDYYKYRRSTEFYTVAHYSLREANDADKTWTETGHFDDEELVFDISLVLRAVEPWRQE